MQTRLCTLGLSLLICLPAVAEAPKPAPAPPAAAPSAAYHWQVIKLNHIAPAAALVALHWNTPTATLPAGVERVYALQSNHSLLLHATDAGFAEATRLVQTVDLPPAAKPDAVPQVRLQVSFISASVMDVDNLGVPFDPAPVPPSEAKLAPQVIQLRTASGNIASQLYQTVMRKPDMVISLPTAVTTDKVAVRFGEDTQIPYLISHSSSNQFGAPPAEKKMRRLQTSLSITPRVNSDGSVTLIFVPLDGDLNAPPKALKVPTAKTVSSGQVVALTGLPFSKEKQTDDQELLVFVTPTVLGAPAAETEVKPPATPIVDTGHPDPPMPGITDTPAEAKRFATVDVYNADMATVVAMLQKQTGLLISLRVGGRPFGNVSVHLEQATPSQVLRAVARSVGATVKHEPDGEYIFAMPASAPGAEIAPFRLLTSPVYRLHSIALKHVRASDVLATMHWGAEHQTPFSPLEEVPPPRRFPFPAGVRQVFVLDQSNTLFADATDQGFAEITRTVKALDHGPQVIEFNTLLLAVPTSRRGLDPTTQEAAKFLTTLLSGTQRLVWAVPVTAEGGQDIAVAVSIRSVPQGFRLSTQRNLDGTLTVHPAFDGISPLPVRTVLPGKATVWEVPNQSLVTGERLFFFVRPTLRPAGVESGETITVTP